MQGGIGGLNGVYISLTHSGVLLRPSNIGVWTGKDGWADGKYQITSTK
ncbi:hypothetical protein [uncultured Eudoraea sp.]|nr:hypothetical protein [uncultured Eudoraea sp.]